MADDPGHTAAVYVIHNFHLHFTFSYICPSNFKISIKNTLPYLQAPPPIPFRPELDTHRYSQAFKIDHDYLVNLAICK